MSYVALYRKFRPDTFEDVKGQEAIVTTLKNQIKSNRVGHAYLFCGTRGTGKTTIAKIMAKAVNCENPVDGSPCGECEMCDLDPNKKCDNCMKCVNSENAEFRGIQIDEIELPENNEENEAFLSELQKQGTDEEA